MVLPLLPSSVAAAAPAAAAVAPVAPVIAGGSSSAAQGLLSATLANLLADVAGQGVNKMLFNPAGGALGPSSYETADPMGRSKYFTSTTEQLAVQQYLANEQFKRALLGAVGLGNMLPELPSREALVGGFQDGKFTGAAALREAQAESLTAREIARIRAEKEFDYAARLAEAQASIQREKVRALSDAQARVESQKVTSLGDIQRQRLQSQYSTASNLLDSVIKNIGFRDKIESGATLTELARAV
jgi:hypothetical protein